jgi:hypothetical protein
MDGPGLRGRPCGNGPGVCPSDIVNRMPGGKGIVTVHKRNQVFPRKSAAATQRPERAGQRTRATCRVKARQDSCAVNKTFHCPTWKRQLSEAGSRMRLPGAAQSIRLDQFCH